MKKESEELEQQTLEDVLEQSEVVSPKEEPKPEPEKVETKEPEKRVSEKPEVEPAEKEEVVEPEKVAEEETKEPELTEEQKEWKRDHENRKKWQGELTRKSQLAANMDDDTIRLVLSHKKLVDDFGKIELPDVPGELEVVVGKDELTEEPVVQKVKPGQIKGFSDWLKKRDEVIRQSYINEIAPKLSEGEKALQEAAELRTSAENQAGRVHIERYFEEFPDAGFDLGEDSAQTLKDIMEAGSLHPDYDKVLNLYAISDRAAKKGISMKQAHIEIFGKSSQEKKAEETIKQEQQGVQQETPSKQTTKKPDDETFIDSNLRDKRNTVNVFE